MKKFILGRSIQINPKYIPLFFILVGFVLYANTLSNPFVHDDIAFILNNPAVIGSKHASEAFTQQPDFLKGISVSNNYYRPLLTIVQKLQYGFLGTDPFGYHIFNIVLHIANSLLVLFFLNHLTKKENIAFIASFLFLIHPVHSETVACISGISNLMFVFLLLSSLLLFIKATGSVSGKERLIFSALSLILFYSSLFAKEHAIILPFLILLYERCFPQNSSNKKDKAQKNIFLFSFFIVSAMFLAFRKIVFGSAVTQIFVDKGEFFLRIFAIPKALLMHLRILILPFDLHYYRCIDILGFQVGAFFLLIAVLSLIVLLLRFLPKMEMGLIIFGLGWFVIGLVPVLNIIPLIHEYSFIAAFDHFSYLSSIGILLILSTLGIYVSEKFFKDVGKMFAQLIVVIIFIACIVLTVYQNTFWQSEVSLFKRVVKYEKNFGRAHLLLGKAYYSTGNYKQAEAEFKKALQIMLSYIKKDQTEDVKKFYFGFVSEIYFNLGHCYLKQGFFEDAIVAYRKLLGYEGHRKAVAHGYIGFVYIRLNDMKQAKYHFEEAIRINPKDVNSLINLAGCYIQEGKIEEAKGLLRRVLKIDPNANLAKQNLRAITEE